MWACKVPSFLFYPEIPNVPGSRWTWPVFLCVYLLFSPFLFAAPEQGFFPCQLDPSSPSSHLSWPITRWSEWRLSGSTICVPVPSWPCPRRPLSRDATCTPSSPSFPCRGAGQLLWICSGLGLASSAGAHVPAQRGTGEQMNLGSSWLPGQGAVGSPHVPRRVSRLLLGCWKHPRWLRGGVHRASSPPASYLINKVGGPPLSQGMPRLCCTQTPRRWSPSPPQAAPPLPAPSGASPRAGVHQRPGGMQQRT